jgi:hypothetical protein
VALDGNPVGTLAGAFRVYRDPQELLESLDELGIPLQG